MPTSGRHAESLSLCSTVSNHVWGTQSIIVNISRTDHLLLLLLPVVIFYLEFYNNLFNVSCIPFNLFHSHPFNMCNKYIRLIYQIMVIPSSKFFHGLILSIKRRGKSKPFSYHARSFLCISVL